MAPIRHARLSASSSARWLNCHGSVRLIESLPKVEKKTNIYAQRGTAIHAAVERHFLEGIEPVPGDEIEGYELTNEDCDGIIPYLQYLQQIIDESVWYRFEVELKLDHIHPDLGGTCDFVSVQKNGVAHVIDLKTGRGEFVLAAMNTQILQYGVGALESIPAEMRKNVKEINLTIFQPYHPMAVDDPAQVWTIDIATLVEHANDLRRAAEEVNADPGLTIGPWCSRCPAMPFCPAMNVQAVALIESAEKTDVSTLTVEQIGDILCRYELIKDWIKEIYSLALSYAEAGMPIPGMKLVPKRKRYDWHDKREALKVLEEYGLRKSEIFEIKMKSPAKILSLKKIPKSIIEALRENVSSGYNLVPSYDAVKGEDLTPALPRLEDL